MNTKTQSRKAEALALLEMQDLTPSQCLRLNRLTAEQQDYSVLSVGLVGHTFSGEEIVKYALFKNEVPVPGTRLSSPDAVVLKFIPNYAVSVDACLTLPLPRYHFWRLWGATSGIPVDRHCAEIMYAVSIKDGDDSSDARSIALAMLKAWWRIQEG